MKYLVFYNDIKLNKEKRNMVLAANNKLEYMLECIDGNGIKCDVISASGAVEDEILRHKKIAVSENLSLELPFSVGGRKKIKRIINNSFIKLWVLFKLLKIKKSDTLAVYHSLYYMNEIKLAKRIKKFKLVLQVEEIYGDVLEKDKISNKEINFFKFADAYIFPTELLNEKINTENKPYTIICGTYKVEPQITSKFGDGKIHIVYAGTFDPRKAGAFATVAAGEFLDRGYHMHILGFGSQKDKENLLSEIERVSKKAECKITFDGLLSGEDYIKFIQSCDIGLSTQNPNAKFNDTSFPSKILSYMANGIRVVSVKIPAIEKSEIGEYMYYYDEQTPQKIAEAIKSINLNDGYNSRGKIEELNIKFIEEIRKIL